MRRSKFLLKHLNGSKVIIIFILVVLLIIIHSYNLQAETLSKRQLFFTGILSYFDVDIKISSPGVFLTDNNGNIIQDGDYVCDFTRDLMTRDNLYTEEKGEWYFNGGRLASPPIIWDKEKVEEAKELVKAWYCCQEFCKWGCANYGCDPKACCEWIRQQCNQDCGFNKPGGRFLDTDRTFVGWTRKAQLFCNNITMYGIKASKMGAGYYSLSNSSAVICDEDEGGIACFACARNNLLAPNGSNSNELYIFKKRLNDKELKDKARTTDFISIDKNDVNPVLEIKNFTLTILDEMVLRLMIKNKGNIPLRIKDFSVLFDDDKVGFVDVLGVNDSEVEPNDNVDVVLKLDKFFDDPCELLDNKLKVVVFYDAPRFKCDFNVDDKVSYDYTFTPDLNTGYDVKEFLPKDDLFVYSKQPRKVKNDRIDLHIGKDDNNGLSRTIILFDKKKLSKELDVDRILKAKLLLSVRDVVDYEGVDSENIEQSINAFEIIKKLNADRTNWFRQPKINDEKIDSFIAREGDGVKGVSVDVTHCLKTKDCYGVVLKADDESEKKETIINALESEEKPIIKVYYETDKTLGDVCQVGRNI